MRKHFLKYALFLLMIICNLPQFLIMYICEALSWLGKRADDLAWFIEKHLWARRLAFFYRKVNREILNENARKQQ